MKNLNHCFLSLALLLFVTNCDTTTNPPEVRYKPGTYTSSAKGFVSEIKVSVAFSEYEITGITIDEHNETIARSSVAYALENIPDYIAQKQSVEVDVVSGATYTSNAIKEAVKNCVSDAMNDT
jgi:fumarate reductase flavoprotein subunit